MKEKFAAVYRYNNPVEVLKINLATSNFEIIAADGVDKSTVAVGFFEIEKNQDGQDLVAITAAPDGPLLIVNSIQYAPKIGQTKIEITDDEKYSHALISDEAKNIFGLFYEVKAGVGSHPYNESREDVDFYFWLSKNIGNPKFYEYYKKNYIYLDWERFGE